MKPLLSFAALMGFNIGAAIRSPQPDERHAERIVDERQIFTVLDAVSEHPGHHA